MQGISGAATDLLPPTWKGCAGEQLPRLPLVLYPADSSHSVWICTVPPSRIGTHGGHGRALAPNSSLDTHHHVRMAYIPALDRDSEPPLRTPLLHEPRVPPQPGFRPRIVRV
jgi:hypothetical protein